MAARKFVTQRRLSQYGFRAIIYPFLFGEGPVASGYHIGHKALDGDHDGMIAVWRELEAGLSFEAAKAAAARLSSIAAEHFAREEQFMLECGYPDRIRHRMLHDDMTVGLRRILLSPLLGSVGHQEFVGFMRRLMNEWIMVHILVEDAKLAPYAARLAAERRSRAVAVLRR